MKKIVLNREDAFEFEIAKGLKELIVDMNSFYHINVTEDEITVGRQGYNTRDIDKVCFDMNNLQSNEVEDQKEAAIVSTYMYTFSKTGDLKKRLSDIYNKAGDLNMHTFYHDRTGRYPEDLIVNNIKFHHSVTFTKGNGK